MNVIFVLPHLEYGSVQAQCLHFVRALRTDDVVPRLLVLGRCGPWADDLRREGIEVDAPGRGRMFDLAPLVRLRRLVRDTAPDAIHAWGASTLRSVALSGFKGRLVVTPMPGPKGPGFIDAFLIRRAQRVHALGDVESQRCLRMGVDPHRLVRTMPLVRARPTTEETPFPTGTRFILCIGSLELHKGFIDAVWAHDMLRYVHPDLHLVVVGKGSERDRFVRFAHGVGSANRVHLLGARTDVQTLLNRAEMVWSPGRSETGTQVMLEAAAAGKPIVASRHPRHEELIVDGETGFLFAVGDRVELAKHTQRLLTENGMLERMGEAARRRAETLFSGVPPADAWAKLYKE